MIQPADHMSEGYDQPNDDDNDHGGDDNIVIMMKIIYLMVNQNIKLL